MTKIKKMLIILSVAFVALFMINSGPMMLAHADDTYENVDDRQPGGEDTVHATGTNFGSFHNMAGTYVRGDCDYNHGPEMWVRPDNHTGIYPSDNPNTDDSRDFCSDNDAFMSHTDKRCVTITGLDYNGQFYIKGDKWYKQPGASFMKVKAYDNDKSSGPYGSQLECYSTKEYAYPMDVAHRSGTH